MDSKRYTQWSTTDRSRRRSRSRSMSRDRGYSREESDDDYDSRDRSKHDTHEKWHTRERREYYVYTKVLNRISSRGRLDKNRSNERDRNKYGETENQDKFYMREYEYEKIKEKKSSIIDYDNQSDNDTERGCERIYNDNLNDYEDWDNDHEPANLNNSTNIIYEKTGNLFNRYEPVEEDWD